MRSDFNFIGRYSSVGKALCSLVKEGKLVRISQGVYAKSRRNRITGDIMVSSVGGFDSVCIQALDRLGVEWDYCKAYKDYLQGSTQIPTRLMVEVKGRFRRSIKVGKFELKVVKK